MAFNLTLTRTPCTGLHLYSCAPIDGFSRNTTPSRAACIQGGSPFAQHAHLANPVRFAGRPARIVVVSASSGDSKEPGAGLTGMTKQQALDILGISREASFDQALQAKNKLSSKESDQDKLMEIDAAYDTLLMESMKQRLSGNVANSVRFADVPKKKPRQQKQAAPSLPGGLKVAKPPQQTLTTQSAVFGLLAVWTLVQALAAPPSAMGAGDPGVPGLQLASAAAASVYFMRENKRLGLGRAAALTGGGFVVGTLIGSLLQNWLRVDIVPIGSFGSPGALVGETAILSLYLVSTFVS